MKFKTLNDSYEEVKKSLKHTLLKSRGVENVDRLLSVDKTEEFRFTDLDNIELAVKGLRWHIKNKSRIVIIVDSDCDGYTSGAVMRNYIKKVFNHDCEYVIHENKSHGIVINELTDIETIDLLIIPDAGTSDTNQMWELREYNPNMSILVLDHHEPVLKESETVDDLLEDSPALIVNPQLDSSSNKELCGVAVVYKFCQAIDDSLKVRIADTFLDLVAIGLIADSMDMKSYETRYLALKGLELIEKDRQRILDDKEPVGNKFVQKIVEHGSDRALRDITIISIGWGLAPVINGTIRFGTMEEKTDMFRAFCEENEEGRIFQPRRERGAGKDSPKPDPIPITFMESVFKQCTSAKGRQDRKTKKYMEELIERITEKKLDENKILMVDSTDTIEEKSLSGLVAGKLTDIYKRPVIVLKKYRDGLYGGSGRNYELCEIENFKDLINDTGIASGAGHQGAFGASIKTENLIPLRDMLNEQLKDMKHEDVYHVDYEISIGRLTRKDVMDVGRLHNIWGNTTMTEPMFAITNMTVDVKDIELFGKYKNTLRIKKGDHKFVKFHSNAEELDEIRMRTKKGFGKGVKQVVLDLVVKFSINVWEGSEYPQIEIIDYNVRKKEEIKF